MTDAERARQFLPYAALTGFEDFIQAEEAEKTERAVPGEDAQEELNRRLQSLRRGDIIVVRHYEKCRYTERRGTVKRIVQEEGILRLEETDIPLADILAVRKEQDA